MTKRSPGGGMASAWLLVLSLHFALGALGCEEGTEIDQDQSVVVGMLLPYTGKDAAMGTAYERAAQMVRDEVNRAGGIGGKSFELVIRDTHSDPERAVDALKEILKYDVWAVIGPESSEAARQLLPLLKEGGIPLISPVISGAESIQEPSGYTWYRLAPSSALLGRSLANFLATESDIPVISIIYSSEDYNVDFAGAFIARFNELGGALSVSVHLTEDNLGYFDEVNALRTGSENILISTSSDTAARFVNDICLTTGGADWSWFLSPLLETPTLVRNTFSRTLDGAVGVGIDVYDESEDFLALYKSKWSDDPIEGAFYYYDAVSLVALSIAQAIVGSDKEAGARKALLEGIRDMATPLGVQVGWDTLPKGLSYIRSGDRVHYSGLTGPLSFDSDGQQERATIKFWKILKGQFTKIN